jgi:glutamate synthase (ferredoxin)
MTGGRVVILGATGRNFAAGMSGGVAYVLDEKGDFAKRVNAEMVGIEKVQAPADIAELKVIIERHLTYTKSNKAKLVLDQWDKMLPRFVKIMPKDYKKVLESIRRVEERGLTGDDAILAAFEENIRDAARAAGK